MRKVIEKYSLQEVVEIVWEYAIEQKRAKATEAARKNIEQWIKAYLFDRSITNKKQTNGTEQ